MVESKRATKWHVYLHIFWRSHLVLMRLQGPRAVSSPAMARLRSSKPVPMLSWRPVCNAVTWGWCEFLKKYITEFRNEKNILIIICQCQLDGRATPFHTIDLCIHILFNCVFEVLCPQLSTSNRNLVYLDLKFGLWTTYSMRAKRSIQLCQQGLRILQLGGDRFHHLPDAQRMENLGETTSTKEIN